VVGSQGFLHTGEDLRKGDVRMNRPQGYGTARWGFSLYGSGETDSKMVGEEDPVANYFPWHVVERSRRDPDLRRFQGVKE
jgi:hypothetical protein